MNFRGSKIFDEHNEEEYIHNRSAYGDQRVSLSKYVDKDYSGVNESNNNRKNSNNKLDEDSFIDAATRNTGIAGQGNFSNNNQYNHFSDKIALIKVLISNYLKEKELDM